MAWSFLVCLAACRIAFTLKQLSRFSASLGTLSAPRKGWWRKPDGDIPIYLSLFFTSRPERNQIAEVRNRSSPQPMASPHPERVKGYKCNRNANLFAASPIRRVVAAGVHYKGMEDKKLRRALAGKRQTVLPRIHQTFPFHTLPDCKRCF
jgi:hypothetical protein